MCSAAGKASSNTWSRVLLLAIVWWSLVGCASHSYQSASVLLPDAHGGGHSLAISQDSLRLSSGSWSGRISIWRLRDGNHQHSWQGHEGDVTGLAYLGGDRLLSAGYDGQLTEWKPAERRVRSVDTGAPINAMSCR